MRFLYHLMHVFLHFTATAESPLKIFNRSWHQQSTLIFSWHFLYLFLCLKSSYLAFFTNGLTTDSVDISSILKILKNYLRLCINMLMVSNVWKLTEKHKNLPSRLIESCEHVIKVQNNRASCYWKGQPPFEIFTVQWQPMMFD